MSCQTPKKKEQNTMNSQLSPPLSTPFLVDSGLKKTAKAMSKESKDTHIYVYMYEGNNITIVL